MSYMKADGMEVYCIMARKGWVTPKAMVEEFEANEYVAACWEIACIVGATGDPDEANPDPYNPYSGATHSHNSNGTGCGWADNQYIREIRDGVFTVTEYGDNILNCRLTKNSRWQYLSDTISNVDFGDTIYWTTSLGNTTWYHYGTVGVANEDHPNRS